MFQINHSVVAPHGPAAATVRPRVAPAMVTVDGADAMPVPTIAAGAPLAPGEVYLDLANPCRGPFRALHGQLAGSRNRYVPRRAISQGLWNQLVERCARIGVTLR